jgi:hypothetical protein
LKFQATQNLKKSENSDIIIIESERENKSSTFKKYYATQQKIKK